eukprot:10939340-Heterocapsa_arctica.AAC.1
MHIMGKDGIMEQKGQMGGMNPQMMGGKQCKMDEYAGQQLKEFDGKKTEVKDEKKKQEEKTA